MLSLAVAAKYAMLLFVPIVLTIMALQTSRQWGRCEALKRLGLAAGFVTIAGVLLLALGGRDLLHGILVTTGQRLVTQPLSRHLLIVHAVEWGGFLFVLAAIGLIFFNSGHRNLPAVLLCAALLTPLYHVYRAEATSMQKDIAFGLFFASPLAGMALTWIADQDWAVSRRWAAVLALLAMIWWVGWHQAQELFTDWPNSAALVQTLRTQVHENDNLLAEEPHVLQYYLQDRVSPRQWHDLYWFEYTNRSGQDLVGKQAYRAAIAEKYFRVVIFYYGHHPATEHNEHGAFPQEVDQGLKSGVGYELVAKQPFHVHQEAGTYWIWRRRDAKIH